MKKEREGGTDRQAGRDRDRDRDTHAHAHTHTHRPGVVLYLPSTEL